MEKNADYNFEIGMNIPSIRPQSKHGNHVSI
jgi:hypothetical protein